MKKSIDKVNFNTIFNLVKDELKDTEEFTDETYKLTKDVYDFISKENYPFNYRKLHKSIVSILKEDEILEED